jgi:hypothetical protein
VGVAPQRSIGDCCSAPQKEPSLAAHLAGPFDEHLRASVASSSRRWFGGEGQSDAGPAPSLARRRQSADSQPRHTGRHAPVVQPIGARRRRRGGGECHKDDLAQHTPELSVTGRPPSLQFDVTKRIPGGKVHTSSSARRIYYTTCDRYLTLVAIASTLVEFPDEMTSHSPENRSGSSQTYQTFLIVTATCHG